MPGSEISNPIIVETTEAKEFDLLHWVQLLWDHRWWIAGCTLAVVILVALYTFLMTPIYSATATVYVQSARPQPVGNFNYNNNSWLEDMKFYSSQIDIMKSSAVMQEVVDKLNLKDHPGFRGNPHPDRALQGMVKVENVKDSALFKITVQAPYKADVALWANTIAEVYRDRSLRDTLDYINQANQLMLSQVREMQQEYVKQQAMVTNTLESSGSYFPQNQKEILDKQIASINEKLTDVGVKESEVAAVVSQMEAWQAHGGDPLSLPAVAQDPSVQDLAKQYNEMSRDLGKLQVKFTPKHPEVIKKQEEMRSLKDRIASQAQVVLGTYRNQLSALRAQRANLMNDLDGARREGLQFVEGASKGEALTTSSAAIKKYMDMLYDKMRELNVSQSLLSTNIRLVDPALPPGSPIKPKKSANLILGLLFGLMLSVGSVVAYQYLDTTVKSVDDVETRLGLNLLTMVPDLSPESERAGVEAFQTLRTALIYASQNQQKNIILITSAAPKEGKTKIVANLGNILASAGDKVLIMDCDLRRPALSRFFNAAHGQKGLTNFLAEKNSSIGEFIKPGGTQANLSVLYSGPIPPNPPELFSMKRFADLLQQLRKEYDWVLIDSPPALSITDGQILAGMSDLVLIVARYRKTLKPMLERTLVTLKRSNAQIAGVVLNAVETHSSYYYDYYYYNHYYYSTGAEPKKLPWIVGKVGEWNQLFRGSVKPKHRHRGAGGEE